MAQRQNSGDQADPGCHTQRLPGGLEVLVGAVGADSAAALDHELTRVPKRLVELGGDSIWDCGRMAQATGGQQRILSEADHILLLSRPDATGLANVRWALTRTKGIEGGGAISNVSLILVGEGPYSATDAAHALGVEVLGVIPRDPRAAAIACGTPGKMRAFATSPLVAAARVIVERLLHESEDGYRKGPPLEECRPIGLSTPDISALTDDCKEDEVFEHALPAFDE